MRILLSNDDGIAAPGLAALRQAVEGLGEIYVAAPASPQSATGHSITLNEPLTVEAVKLAGRSDWPALSVDGRPADCVRLAARTLLPQPPELVLTGINAGANVGVNVFYSGTVAAAAEAAMLGMPAVAFSAQSPGSTLEQFRPIGRLCRAVLEQLLAAGLTAGDLINVNIPGLGGQGPRGLRVVAQSTAGIEDIYHRQTHPDGRERYMLGQDYSFIDQQEDTDVVCLAEGYVTLTPLHVDMTNHDRLAAFARRQWILPPMTGPGSLA